MSGVFVLVVSVVALVVSVWSLAASVRAFRAVQQRAILDVLKAGPSSARDICARLGIKLGTAGAASIVVQLARLETAGRLKSWWEDPAAPTPRTRIYACR